MRFPNSLRLGFSILGTACSPTPNCVPLPPGPIIVTVTGRDSCDDISVRASGNEWSELLRARGCTFTGNGPGLESYEIAVFSGDDEVDSLWVEPAEDGHGCPADPTKLKVPLPPPSP